MQRPITFLALVLTAAVADAQGRSPAQTSARGSAGPTIDDLISLKRIGSPSVSPDGGTVAYTVRETNWDDNLYDTEIWLADVPTGATRQLTNANKSSTSPAWSPDGSRLAFASDRSEKRQIYLIDPTGGEADRLTSSEEGVSGFKWSPDGSRIAYTATDPKDDPMKDREKKYGEFEVVDQDHRMAHLYVIEVTSKKKRRLTSGPFVVGSFDWSPDGRQIAFDHRLNSDPASRGTADVSIVAVQDGAVRPLVAQEGPDEHPTWSPDGTRIAFETAMADPWFYYTNSIIATVPASGGAVRPVTTDFDEDVSLIAWKPSGIFFAATERTWSYLYGIDPTSRRVTRFAPAEQWIGSAFSLNADGETAAFIAADPASPAELYVAPLKTIQSAPAAGGAGERAAPRPRIKKLTDMGAQTAKWAQPKREIVTWKSQDGAAIEGVLHKPADFQVGKRYPLLVVIHGGPTGVSRPIPFNSTSTYPIDVWLTKGALVLEPNYRGSAGYGQKFRSLNVRNLGVGDAWDVLSGVDHLIKEGLADESRIGAMGWSQGGYISAFLTTHDSARFKAISVGAGISDWMTYYVNTDIHPFTRQYLKATPWDDPEIYAKTSPITYIKGAKAPTLIQHGATDQRVPLPNAFELYQGLQDQGVPTKLVVYKGFGGIGHGPSAPKSSRALMEHNLEWFNTYLFGRSAPTSPQTGR